jgi:hypothetical protein
MKQGFRKFESFADMATLAVIGALGLAMLIGLATASGGFL